MPYRFLKIVTLFLSCALAALPVQQAFASPLYDMTAGTANSSHCQNMAAGDHQAMAVSAMVKGEPMNCCDQCEASCASHCVSAAILLPTASIRFDVSTSGFEAIQIPLLNRATSPDLPPPLS